MDGLFLLLIHVSHMTSIYDESMGCYIYFLAILLLLVLFLLVTQSLLCLTCATKIKMLGLWLDLLQILNIPDRALAFATQNQLSPYKDMAILKGKNLLFYRQTYGKLPGLSPFVVVATAQCGVKFSLKP